MSERKWFCMRCLADHDIVDGVVQCDWKPSGEPITAEQVQAALDWALSNPIKTVACTCSLSSFGMDVDRCPVHGEGCA